MIAAEDICAIVQDHPTLGASFGQYHAEFPSDNAEELKRDREELRRGLKQFQTVCKWLSKVEKSNSINHGHSSYGMKHRVEQYYDP